MTFRLLVVVRVPKQGLAHHLSMVNWCIDTIGVNQVRWFGYDVGASTVTIFHFCSYEDSTAFVIRWGGYADKGTA